MYKWTVMRECPCNSGNALQECCGKIIENKSLANSAEQLMRARYTAHVLGVVDFIMDTFHPSVRPEMDKEAIYNWAVNTQWIGLEVLSVRQGKIDDTKGRVVFKAHFNSGKQKSFHHEDAYFQKVGTQWYYCDGKTPTVATLSPPQIGRNAPCFCGSGKKFKKCCAKNL